ncbi:hypothetical protein [Rubrivirga sp. IMCC43871]|uniref:hypothetical protein n=1 Tax=Rubrivirga sp. IMCC43871 TaxID=3391575 RepID=UPI00399004D9
MTRSTILSGAAALVVALALGYAVARPDTDGAVRAVAEAVAPDAEPEDAPGFLYGRVVATDGSHYQGRLRWGGGEEAFWSDTFIGIKDENPWAADTPLADRVRPPELFGIAVPWAAPEVDLARPFMARFGDIARIESLGDGVRGVVRDGADFDPTVRVVLKSGAVVDLDRLSSSDFDDGVRVWDRRGVVDLGPGRIRSIEFLPTVPLAGVPRRLHGTVHTPEGTFTGVLQWDRAGWVGSDRLVGRSEDGDVSLRFDAIRSLSHRSGGILATLRDGREVALSGPRPAGVTVDDPRYGRVRVSWGTLERVDLRSGDSGPGYDAFPTGRLLRGRVTTRDGRRLAGRLVYDLDESETTETLDAPAGGVDYTIPFGRVRSIVLSNGASAEVTLDGGEVLALERRGDLGPGNAGLLVLADDDSGSEYVPWPDVQRIEVEPSGG